MTNEETARRPSGPAVPVRGCAVVVEPPRRRLTRVERSSLVVPRDALRRGSPRDSPAFCKRRAEQTCCQGIQTLAEALGGGTNFLLVVELPPAEQALRVLERDRRGDGPS